jgi:RNA recognition motif-containing protein
MNIQISNLNTSIDNEELKKLFSNYGEVKSAQVVNDVFTNTSRGFGFVEMDDTLEAKNAIEGLNNTVLENLTLTVEEAKQRHEHKGSYKIGNGPIEVYRFNRKK